VKTICGQAGIILVCGSQVLLGLDKFLFLHRLSVLCRRQLGHAKDRSLLNYWTFVDESSKCTDGSPLSLSDRPESVARENG